MRNRKPAPDKAFAKGVSCKGVATADEIARNITARAMASAGLDEIAAAVAERGSFQAVWDEVERMTGAVVAAYPPRV